MTVLADQIALLDTAAALELRGQVQEVRGLAVRVAELPVPVGTSVTICSNRNTGGDGVLGEVVGFDRDLTIVMPLGATAGIGAGDGVIAGQQRQTVRVGPTLLGRVLDGLGRPIDRKGPLLDTVPRPLTPR